MYWFRRINAEFSAVSQYVNNHFSRTTMLIIVSFFCAISTILQSMGAILPGIGYILSSLSTAPIIFSALFSIRSAITAYILVIILLLVFQLSEIIIFSFTTGLLGLALGFGFQLLHSRILIILCSLLSLLAGSFFLIYILQFPLLGPNSDTISITGIIFTILFYLIYCWIWTELTRMLLGRVVKILRINISEPSI